MSPLTPRPLPHTPCKGQSTVEYAVLGVVVIAALLAMQVYMKRGVQGKLHDASDQVGEQFSPTAYSGKFTVVRRSATRDLMGNVVADLAVGASRSEANVPISARGVSQTGIFQERTSVPGNPEELTNEQKDDGGTGKGKLF